MLDNHLRPREFGSIHREDWESYSGRLGLPDHEPTRQFYRQVVYDHYEYFNDLYPWFEMDNYEFVSISLRADEIARDVRYFDSEPLNSSSFWYDQFDYFLDTQPDYIVFREMIDVGRSHSRPLSWTPAISGKQKDETMEGHFTS
jgi:hypothetical protein